MKMKEVTILHQDKSLINRLAKLVVAALCFLALSPIVTPVFAQDNRIEFWTQDYGDQIAWDSLFRQLSAEFEEESGIAVDVEIINWSTAFNTWFTVAQGGAHPDVADMYWLFSFAAIGGDQYGPLPLNEYKDEVWPDLEERFFPAALQDVFWQGDFYGIPWRGDIRPLIYRTDIFAESGITSPPTTWNEITDYAKQLTERDENGNVTRWGFAFGGGNLVTQLMPYYWQAGGEFMTEDGLTATIDNEAMRTTLEWMRAMVWEHQVVSPEFMEQGYDPQPDFVTGNVAMIGNVSDEWGGLFTAEYPELEGKWAMTRNAAGPESRAAFSGAGYWGVLRGSDKVEQSVRWIEFLSRDENLQRLTEATARVSTSRAVMASDYWSDADWKVAITDTLQDAHTSQHPAPSWSTIAAPEPGAVLYDMFYDAVVRQQDVNEVLARAQQRMQEELERSAP